MVKSEREFADFLESQGKTWIHHPKRFIFDGDSYQTDFYCPEDNTYYEVKTNLGLEDIIRLLRFKKFHPNIKFKVVSSNGYSYYSRSSGAFFKAIYKKLNLLKSKDILELSYEDFEYVRDFSKWKSPNDYGNGRKVFPVTNQMMKNIQKIKKQLAIRRHE